MSGVATLRFGDVKVDDELPGLDVPLTPTVIIAGAIASRDYQDVHHDRDLAQQRGSKDIFMNILTTNGYVGRFVTDWAGPDARLRKVDIRLGVPNYPYDTMKLRGSVRSCERMGGAGIVTVEIVGKNELGDHVTGTVELELPLDD